MIEHTITIVMSEADLEYLIFVCTGAMPTASYETVEQLARCLEHVEVITTSAFVNVPPPEFAS